MNCIIVDNANFSDKVSHINAEKLSIQLILPKIELLPGKNEEMFS